MKKEFTFKLLNLYGASKKYIINYTLIFGISFIFCFLLIQITIINFKYYNVNFFLFYIYNRAGSVQYMYGITSNYFNNCTIYWSTSVYTKTQFILPYKSNIRNIVTHI